MRIGIATSLVAVSLLPPGASGQEPAGGPVARGQELFGAVCSACHTLLPPARQAPPMSHVARHYRAQLGSGGAVAERVAAWVREPAPERSLLPPHAVARWGLMPALPLAAEDLAAVGRYVAVLAFDSTESLPGRGRGPGRGMGMGMRHGIGR